jgi:lysophospholipase L1-like esterase
MLYTFLSLGDSYTIGEQVDPHKNFPHQVVSLLQKCGYDFSPPTIIAQTGWTTDELGDAIKQAALPGRYDFVTLLAGVNNQYRGRSAEDYLPEFEALLKRAIRFASDRSEHVIVLSIPDWGATPFASDRNRGQITREIDEYNMAKKLLATIYKARYLDVTPWTREAAQHPSLLAADGLHPSAVEYRRWAEKISEIIIEEISLSQGT